MDSATIEAGLKQIEEGVAAVRAELSKETGVSGSGTSGEPGAMATPAGAGPASNGITAFLGK